MIIAKNRNLPCKPTNKIRQNREASLYYQQRHHHSLINILTKYSVVTNYKCKSQIEQKSIVVCQLLSNSQPVDQYSISRIVYNVIVFLSVTARIINSPFFPLYSSLGINSKTCGYLVLEMCQHDFFLRILKIS